MERGYDPAGQEETQWKKNKNNKMKNTRRFSDEQIRLLESIFETDTKLEPRKKLQLARELGLQPRQVAIWFQNRRARWKSKQIEQDYRALKADYDKLAARFESLKKEKQSLVSQLQNLKELDGEPHDINKASKDLDGYTKSEPEAEASLSFPLEDRGFLGLQIENEREEFVSIDEYRNESPASPEKLYGFDSTVNIFDQSCSNPQWLNFWSRGED